MISITFTEEKQEQPLKRDATATTTRKNNSNNNKSGKWKSRKSQVEIAERSNSLIKLN